MLDSACAFVGNLYETQDLNGEFLLTPLKDYHDCFSDKVKEAEGCEKVAWIVAHVVSGFFAYTVLGLFASVGMLVKLAGVPSLYSHNENEIKLVEAECRGIEAEQEYYVSKLSREILPHGYEWYNVSSKLLSTDTYQLDCAEVIQSIKEQSRRLTRVYLTVSGAIDKAKCESNLLLQVKVLIPSDPDDV